MTLMETKRLSKVSFLTSVGIAMGSLLAIAPIPSASAETVNTARYRCEEGGTFRVEYYDDSAIVVYGEDLDQTVTLPRVESGSGTRYSDGNLTLYSQGDEAFMELDDERIYDDCEAYLVGSSEYTEMTETIVIEESTRPRYNRPETPTF